MRFVLCWFALAFRAGEGISPPQWEIRRRLSPREGGNDPLDRSVYARTFRTKTVISFSNVLRLMRRRRPRAVQLPLGSGATSAFADSLHGRNSSRQWTLPSTWIAMPGVKSNMRVHDIRRIVSSFAGWPKAIPAQPQTVGDKVIA
jgi:hypothetical protein